MRIQIPTWTETASADNALATATKAAQSGSHHVIVYVLASYSNSATSGLLTIKQGTTTVGTHYIHGADIIPLDLDNPDLNEAVSAELAASGTAGTLGKITLVGYTY